VDDYRPFNVVLAFDHPQKTFRHQLQESIKAQRKPMPDD
jgi:5'-3' exonuclease